MNFKKLGILLGAILVLLTTVVCSTVNIPLGSSASPTPSSIEDWVEGHYWSIKVVNVETQTQLDGKSPQNDLFLLVDVQWKANSLTELHQMDGVDYKIVDNNGDEYAITGMIYESGTFDSFSTNAEYQKGKWRVSRVSGTKGDTYRLVFDMPTTAKGLKLWFRNYPLIDIGL